MDPHPTNPKTFIQGFAWFQGPGTLGKGPQQNCAPSPLIIRPFPWIRTYFDTNYSIHYLFRVGACSRVFQKLGTPNANLPISQDSLSGGFRERSHLFRLAELVSTNPFSTHSLVGTNYSSTGMSKKYVWRTIFNIGLFRMFSQRMLV